MNPDPLQPIDPSGPDELEHVLARNPLRSPPPEWRDAILTRASSEGRGIRVSSISAEACSGTRITRLSQGPDSVGRDTRFLLSWWDRLASGWTVAAAAWVLAFALNHLATPSVSPPGPPRPPFSDAALAEIRAQQRQMMSASNPQNPLT